MTHHLSKLLLIFICLTQLTTGEDGSSSDRVFRAGTAMVDVTPTEFPVSVNGQSTERVFTNAVDRLMSRALVLDDRTTRLAIVIIDSCMIPRELLDAAKEMAHEETNIPTSHMLVSATHTHNAPAAMRCLGCPPDDKYPQVLPSLIARSIILANERLVPARVGWNVIQDPQHNHCRRWIFRPDRMEKDVFGRKTVRANMYPPHQSPNHLGPSGPADQDLSLLSVQTLDGRPLAVLGNYAMHYWDPGDVLTGSFCGRFGDAFAQLIGVDQQDGTFVGMMSQGTSGDSMWPDYSRPPRRLTLDEYTEEVASYAVDAYRTIKYHNWVPLVMAESKLELQRRVPNQERLAWARQIIENLKGRTPRNKPEIYAFEALYLHENPQVEIKLQAIRIGGLGITASPNEVFGITGLKLKSRSPLQPTFNIELANGAQGYIPPPEQHRLGGYSTWPALTAGLEMMAEPKIVEELLELLEKVTDRPRRPQTDPVGAYSQAVMESRPQVYWRLGEIEGAVAMDAVGQRHGVYEGGVAFYLPGPAGEGLDAGQRGNRAAHFVGGRVKTAPDNVGKTYSLELWFWNGLPNDARPITGYIFSRGPDGADGAPGDHLGICGTFSPGNKGKLIFFNGDHRSELLMSQSAIAAKTWNHLVLIRNGTKVKVFLNGESEPEIDGVASVSLPRGMADDIAEIFIGGRSDNFSNFEGKLDEVAVYDRVLSVEEIDTHFKAAGRPIEVEMPPNSPAESLAAWRVRSGYRIELMASEPLVADPVAIDWGPDGRLWVAEMADYPVGIDGKGKPGGRIRFLEDTDGDDRYDTSTVFLENIRFPTGIMAWRGGVLVTAAPDIFFAEDTDRDGRADKRKTLYRGFVEDNQQLRVNGLRWGLDNWIYCASGSPSPNRSQETRISAQLTNHEIQLGARDFRIRPDQGHLDPQSGPSQFGRCRNDWGDWFGVQNVHPIWHYVLADHYTRRNPHYAPPDPKRDLYIPHNPRIFPAKTPQKRFHSFQQAGHFTSACGIAIYRGDLLFARDTVEHSFTCEPFHNVVHHAVMDPDGVSFVARRDQAETTSEFLASTDRWCRPVMARTGPDGALWVVDMYRYMIEHPEWLPEKGKKELEPFSRSGDDRGRIYRVVPEGSTRLRAISKVDHLDTKSLVNQLESPNGPLRDMTQRLLIQRHDKGAIPLLREMTVNNQSPLARLHALCTLDGLEVLNAESLRHALNDPHPAVRQHALRLSESRAPPELVVDSLALLSDPDAKVRLQLANTLGEWKDSGTAAAATALAQLAADHAENPYMIAAVMSSIHSENIGPVVKKLLASERGEQLSKDLVASLSRLAVILGNRELVQVVLLRACTPHENRFDLWQFFSLAAVLETMDNQGLPIQSFDNRVRKTIARAIAHSRQLVRNPDTPAELRSASIQCLLREPDHLEEDYNTLARLLSPQTPPDIQADVIDRLAQQSDVAAADILLANWSSHSPPRRKQVLAVLASRASWTKKLLGRIEQGRIAAGEIDAAARQRFLAHDDEKLLNELKKLFVANTTIDRRKVIDTFQQALELDGNPTKGRVVFKNKCATCHKYQGLGREVGPNLATLTNRTPPALLETILDPSRAVEAKYLNYVAVTRDGRTITGILATETASSITLLEADKRHVILRTELEELQSSRKSLMPDGLEQNLSQQDMADLISFIVGNEP